MADAEKKDIAKLSFDVQDAKQGLLDIGSLLDDLSKKSTTTFDKISKEFKSSFKGAEIIDVKAAQVNMDKVYTMSKQNSERIAVTNNRIAGKIKTIETQKNADIEKLNIQHQNKMEEINSRQLTSAKTIADKITEYAKTYLVYQGFNALKNMAKDVIDEMVNVEYQMVEIDRVLNDSSINIDNYRGKLIQLAQDYGNSFDNVADITLRLAQAGFNADESLALTEKTLLALNTAELDATQATSDMIAVMAQFGLTTGTTSEIAGNYGDIIDKINKVADNFPTTSEDILNALKKTGSAFNLAGASIDETIATIVAAEKASQRGGKVIGTALSNIVQQLKAEGKINIMESLGLDIYTDSTKTEFKGIMEIFEQLSEKMQSLKKAGKENSVEMQNLLEVFTVFRRNVGASLLGEMAGEDSTYAQVLKTSIDSVGYSIQENEKHMKTAKAAQAQFNAELLKLKTEVWDNGLEDVFRNLLSFGKDIASGINGLIKDIGVLPTAIGAITLALTALNKSTQAGTYIKAIPTIKEINKLLDDTSKGITDVSKYQSNYDNIIKKSDSNFQAYAKSVGKGNISLSSYAGYLVKSTAKTIALTAATIALQAAISAGVSVAITLLVTAIDNWIHADEKIIKKNNELKQQAEDNASKYNEETTAIKDLRKEYEELAKKKKRTPEEEERIYEIQTQLNSLIKNTGKQVELINTTLNEQQKKVTKVNKKYNEQLNILKQIELEKKKQEVQELKKAADAANENLNLINSSEIQGNWFDAMFKGNNKVLAEGFVKAGISKAQRTIFGTINDISINPQMYEFNNSDIQKKISLLEEWKQKLEAVNDGNQYVSESLKLVEGALKNVKEKSDAATKATDKYNNALRELIAQSSNLTEYNTALNAISKTYGNDKEVSKMIESIYSLNQQFTDGKITVNEYYETLQKTIKGINFTTEDGIEKTGAELQGLQAIFAETTRYIVENLQSIQTSYDEGKSTFKDYANGLTQTNKSLLELYSKENDLHYVQGQGWLDANDKLDEYANSLQNLQNEMNSFNGVLDTMSKSYSYIAENANAFGEAAFEASNLADKSYKQLVNGFTNNLFELKKESATAFHSIIAEVAQVTGDTSTELANSNTYLKNVFLNNSKAFNIALNETAGQAQTAASNMAKATGGLIEKLGEVISNFDYTINFGIEGGISPGGNILDLVLGKKFQPTSDLQLKVTGTGGNSVAGLGKALKSFASEFMNYYESSLPYKSLVDLIKPTTPYIPSKRKDTPTIYSPSGSGKGSKSNKSSSKTDAEKAAEEEYKRKLSVLETYFDTIEEKENRWVKKQKELGQLSNKDFIYITQQRIKRHEQYLKQIKKATWLNAEDRAKLEKEYTEKLEDYRLEYFDYLKNILDEEIKALEDARDKEIEQLKETNSKKIELIEEEAQKRIDALKKVENENDRIRAKEEYQKKRQEHLTDISYWEQRTGREAKEALKEAKKNLKELDEEWKQQQEDWDISDQIEAIENQRDAQVKAIQDAQEAQIKAIEESTQKQINELQRIYDARVKLFSETNQIIFEDSRIASEKLFEIYKKGFVDPLSAEFKKLEQSLKPATKTTTTKKTETKKEYVTYKIKSGDTLSAIAKKYGTTVSKIMAANPSIKNRNLIYTGNKLKIPKFHNGGIVGGNQEGWAILKPNEVVLKPEWADGINRLASLVKNNQTSNIVSSGPTITVKGDLVRIDANIKNKTDAEFLTKKVEKMLESKFNIKK